MNAHVDIYVYSIHKLHLLSCRSVRIIYLWRRRCMHAIIINIIPEKMDVGNVSIPLAIRQQSLKNFGLGIIPPCGSYFIGAVRCVDVPGGTPGINFTQFIPRSVPPSLRLSGVSAASPSIGIGAIRQIQLRTALHQLPSRSPALDCTSPACRKEKSISAGARSTSTFPGFFMECHGGHGYNTRVR